jgi:hypothetical protein
MRVNSANRRNEGKLNSRHFLQYDETQQHESKLGKSLQRETTLEIYSSTEEPRMRINSANYRNESKLNT